jgi:hypothetical protein
MQEMIEWFKVGISAGYITSEEAFTWLARLAPKAERATARPVTVVEYPASALQQPKPRRARSPAAAVSLVNKDGTPRKKPGRKPKAQPEGSASNGVE